jgi:hypothetical protein
MPRRSKNTFLINGDTISIMCEGWNEAALATYRADYYDELSSHTWSVVNGYPTNKALGGGLHRYIIRKWYGDDVLKTMTERGFVVDHMNNHHMDCRISNLEFLKHNRNVAKGQYFDMESKKLRKSIAVSIYKDFNTQCYQITIGCNDFIVAENGKSVQAIKLLYNNCSYSQVILDAESILTMYDEERRISLEHLQYCDQRIVFAPDFELTDEEQKQSIVVRDGIPFLVIGNGKAYINSIHYDENWYPPNDREKNN